METMTSPDQTPYEKLIALKDELSVELVIADNSELSVEENEAFGEKLMELAGAFRDQLEVLGIRIEEVLESYPDSPQKEILMAVFSELSDRSPHEG